MITVIIADDHAIIRDGLKAMLAGAAGIEIVGCAGNGKQAIDMLEGSGADVILMDISMPEMNGIEATKIITEKYPDVKEAYSVNSRTLRLSSKPNSFSK